MELILIIVVLVLLLEAEADIGVGVEVIGDRTLFRSGQSWRCFRMTGPKQDGAIGSRPFGGNFRRRGHATRKEIGLDEKK